MSAMIQLPLDIPDVKVLSTECRPDGALLIKVESTRRGTCCSRCGREIQHFHGYDRPIQLRHLPILEWREFGKLFWPISALSFGPPYRGNHHQAPGKGW